MCLDVEGCGDPMDVLFWWLEQYLGRNRPPPLPVVSFHSHTFSSNVCVFQFYTATVCRLCGFLFVPLRCVLCAF